ncbi:MAG: sigma-70 family RNA polymerase sigma factor [Ruminococcus sp.]|nr:sigma-70 family RNA polymerase sigma factor [Ruminococcus sp.]
MDDLSIIELFRKRDEKAITELKEKYERVCLNAAGSILSVREDIEECVNSAYYEVWNKIPPESPDCLKAYLCRIVRNIAVNKLRYNYAEKRNVKLAVSLDELAECIPDRNTDDLSAEKLAAAISIFLRTQDERNRKIFIRRYWYGESLSEIARFFDMNEKTAATCLFRTRKKLKEFLQKEGYYHE